MHESAPEKKSYFQRDFVHELKGKIYKDIINVLINTGGKYLLLSGGSIRIIYFSKSMKTPKSEYSFTDKSHDFENLLK